MAWASQWKADSQYQYRHLSLQKQEVHLEGRPPIGYDVLSLDTGITPSAQGVPGALEHATPVKPVHK